MKLADIEDVIRLRNYRAKAIDLQKSAESGFMELRFAGFDDPASCISLECVRRAVSDECQREIDGYDDQLRKLGVEI